MGTGLKVVNKCPRTWFKGTETIFSHLSERLRVWIQYDGRTKRTGICGTTGLGLQFASPDSHVGNLDVAGDEQTSIPLTTSSREMLVSLKCGFSFMFAG